MTKETLLKLHKHFSYLAEGKFTESDFDMNLKGGKIQMGEMPPERKQLIISDAKRNLEELERKHPDLFSKDKSVLDKIVENKEAKKGKK